MVLIVDNQRLETTEQGFLVNLKDWNEAVALRLAEAENLALTEQHWEIIHFIKGYYGQI
jgi:tRNA 2-thiouridine synthesizing protein E